MTNPAKFKHKKAAFSLIEIIVVMGMFIALSSVFIISYGQAKRSRDIQIAMDSSQSALRQMQNHVLSGLPYSSTFPAQDYGFKITNGGSQYETFTEESVTLNYRSLEIYNFPPNIVFSSLTVTSSGLTQNATDVEIRFFPPFADIKVTAKDGPTTLFTQAAGVIVNFRITFSGSSQSRQLTVDGVSGRISEF